MNMNVSLTDELANFVKSKVAAGRYSSSSEVVREALRRKSSGRKPRNSSSCESNACQEGIASGDVGAPHIPLAVIANWGVPQPVAEGG